MKGDKKRIKKRKDKEANEQEIATEGAKPKKRKRHRLLKLLILTVIAAAIWKGSRMVSDKAAEQKIATTAMAYPFLSFVCETDSAGYITEDFILTDYSDDGLEWECDSECITFERNGDGTVTAHVERQSGEAEGATLRLVSKIANGEASYDYDITIPSTSALSPDDVQVVTKEMVESGEYKREMTVVSSKEGYITDMIGDFNTEVNSIEDGLAVIEAYKEELGIDSRITYRYANSFDFGDGDIFYRYYGYYNDAMLSGFDIIVDMLDYNKLRCINCDFQRYEIKEENFVQQVDFEALLDEYLKDYMRKNGGDSYEITEQQKKGIPYGGEIVMAMNYTVKIYTDGKSGDEDCYYATVYNDDGYVGMKSAYKEWSFNKDGTGGEDVDEMLARLSQDDVEMAHCVGMDEKRNWRLFEAAALTDENTETTSYMLYDKNRNIYCIGYDEGFSSSDMQVFSVSMSVAVQFYDNIQEIYDWYMEEHGLIGYDGNGSALPLVYGYTDGYDNAYQVQTESGYFIKACDAIKYDRSLTYSKVVMAHEYTHAVASYAKTSEPQNKDNEKENEWTSKEDAQALSTDGEQKAISESIADVMALAFAGDDEWLCFESVLTGETESGDEHAKEYKEHAGETVYTRNPMTINSGITEREVISGKEFPETYDKSTIDWYDYHGTGVMLTHVAWRMKESGFSNEQIADIWMQYIEKHFAYADSFTRFRKDILDSMEKLGYSSDEIDMVDILFAEIGLSDEYDEAHSNGIATDGDPILDDSDEKEFVVSVSPLKGIIYSNALAVDIYVPSGTFTEEEIEEMKPILQASAEKYMESLGIPDVIGVDVEMHEVNFFMFLRRMMMADGSIKDYDALVRKVMNISGNYGDGEEWLAVGDVLTALKGQSFYVQATSFDLFDELFDISETYPAD